MRVLVLSARATHDHHNEEQQSKVILKSWNNYYVDNSADAVWELLQSS